MGAAEAHPSLFERLTQLIKHGASEFSQFIEKKNATMGKAEFARSGIGTSTEKGSGRAAVVWFAKRSLPHQLRGVLQLPCHRVNTGDCQSFISGQWWQQLWKLVGQMGLPAAWRSDEQQMMSAGGGKGECPCRQAVLSGDAPGKVDPCVFVRGLFTAHERKGALPPELLHEFLQVVCSEDMQIRNQCRLICIGRWNHEPFCSLP